MYNDNGKVAINVTTTNELDGMTVKTWMMY